MLKSTSTFRCEVSLPYGECIIEAQLLRRTLSTNTEASSQTLRRKVLSQQMVTTPITELDSDIIQKDRGYEPNFSI